MVYVMAKEHSVKSTKQVALGWDICITGNFCAWIGQGKMGFLCWRYYFRSRLRVTIVAILFLSAVVAHESIWLGWPLFHCMLQLYLAYSEALLYTWHSDTCPPTMSHMHQGGKVHTFI